MVKKAAFLRHTARERAFSLAELLTVILIIALLITISAPSIARALVVGRETKCRTNLAALTKACSLFAAENNRFVPTGDPYNSSPDVTNIAAKTWFNLSLPSSALVCPGLAYDVQYFKGGTNKEDDNKTPITEESLRAYTAGFNTPTLTDRSKQPYLKSRYQYLGTNYWPADTQEARDACLSWQVLKIESSASGGRQVLFSDYVLGTGTDAGRKTYDANHGPDRFSPMLNVGRTDGSVTWKLPEKDPYVGSWYW
jgi:type II secretory pathway pseudopilin PulG